MPRENLEIVREMYERRESGDMYVGEFVHPEIVFVRIGSEAPDFAGEWHGVEGLRQATAEYLNVWEDYRFEVDRGLIVRWEYYWERSDALEAAGIAE